MPKVLSEIFSTNTHYQNSNMLNSCQKHQDIVGDKQTKKRLEILEVSTIKKKTQKKTDNLQQNLSQT